MTYRARAEGRSGRRRARREALIQREARRIAELHPHVVTRYEPARPPFVQPVARRQIENFGYVEEVELGARPQHRTIAVPVRSPQYFADVRMDPRRAPMQRDVVLQAVEYRLDVDATRVRWWGWEPVQDALKPEVRHGLSRARAYAERAKSALAYIGYRAHSNPQSYFDVAHRSMLEAVANWCAIVVEDVEQCLGEP